MTGFEGGGSERMTRREAERQVKLLNQNHFNLPFFASKGRPSNSIQRRQQQQQQSNNNNSNHNSNHSHMTRSRTRQMQNTSILGKRMSI